MFVADTIRAGDRLQMSAQVIGRSGEAISGAVVAWASSDHAVATVSASGLVTPTAFGSTVITASATKVAKATIVVLPATRTIQLTPSSDTIFVEDPIALRDTVRLKATAFDDSGKVVTGMRFSWTSSTPAIATVDGAGLVSARTLGTVTITAQSGERTRAATLRVLPVVKSIQVSASVTTVLVRDTMQLTAVALGYDDKPIAGRTFSWASAPTSPRVADVDANGRAIFQRSGTATFTAKSSFTTANAAVTALERQLQIVSSGDDFTCGFTNLGRGYCWGVGDFGQLGSNADSSCFDALDPPLRGAGDYACTVSPKRHAGVTLVFRAVDAGGSSACGITQDRLIYCWGDDTFGQIGNGLKGSNEQPSLATVAQERFDSITVGGEPLDATGSLKSGHACALTTTGRTYCWGADSLGQLGDNRRVNSTTPIPVIGGLSYSSISAGGRHTCAISNGQAFCWG